MRSVPRKANICLRLEDKVHLPGQRLEELADSPLYATVKEVQRSGREPTIEINYMVRISTPHEAAMCGASFAGIKLPKASEAVH